MCTFPQRSNRTDCIMPYPEMRVVQRQRYRKKVVESHHSKRRLLRGEDHEGEGEEKGEQEEGHDTGVTPRPQFVRGREARSSIMFHQSRTVMLESQVNQLKGMAPMRTASSNWPHTYGGCTLLFSTSMHAAHKCTQMRIRLTLPKLPTGS